MTKFVLIGGYMENSGKTLKEYCKDAKKRLKNGFWQTYHKDLQDELVRAEKEGISASKVKEYYSQDLIAVEVELLEDPFIYIKEETYNQMKGKDKE